MSTVVRSPNTKFISKRRAYVRVKKQLVRLKCFTVRPSSLLQARVMRDFKDVGQDGVPRSRGYGFVSFTDHEHALAALRNVNNNPDIFTYDQVSDCPLYYV